MNKFLTFFLGLFFSFSQLYAEGNFPRTILALYNGDIEKSPDKTLIYRFLETPLNHLGIIVQYHDIMKGYPLLEKGDDYLGVVSCFVSGTVLKNPYSYLDWCKQVLSLQKKFIIVGEPGFFNNYQGTALPIEKINEFLHELGIHYTGYWVRPTYELKILYLDKSMIAFERDLKGIIPAYEQLRLLNREDSTSYLRIRQVIDDQTKDSDIVMVTPYGGYISDGFAYYNEVDEKIDRETRQWIINPFLFFEAALQLETLPKPDTTTVAGRRIYYCHIDGDGWNNATEIEKYAKKEILSSEIILEEILKKFPEMPVTVGPIGAELDPSWAGTEKSMDIAKLILSLPNVQAGTHTYSHPFAWEFFMKYSPDIEEPFLYKYTTGSWQNSAISWIHAILNTFSKKTTKQDLVILGGYEMPRAYAQRPFDIVEEINGSTFLVDSLCPKNKQVELIQWSGDCKIFEEAMDLARHLNLSNINGGETRFDKDYPSYAWISPLGRKVGLNWQVFSSNCNENIYTNLWTDRYYGFIYLKDTFIHTESPFRIRPMNLYYHIYSGEKRASLNAVISNIDYILRQEKISLTAKQFSQIVQGFYSATLHEVEKGVWKIQNRGALNTFRIDHSRFKSIDIEKCKGVIGYRLYQNSLYIFTDPTAEEPYIVLSSDETISRPSLLESSWHIYNIQQSQSELSFYTKGFEKGIFRWRFPEGKYAIYLGKGKDEAFIVESNNKELYFELPFFENKEQQITIRKVAF